MIHIHTPIMNEQQNHSRLPEWIAHPIVLFFNMIALLFHILILKTAEDNFSQICHCVSYV